MDEDANSMDAIQNNEKKDSLNSITTMTTNSKLSRILEKKRKANEPEPKKLTKRQKKLEQYIEKKLKKEERALLLTKLASASQFEAGVLKPTSQLWSRTKPKKVYEDKLTDTLIDSDESDISLDDPKSIPKQNSSSHASIPNPTLSFPKPSLPTPSPSFPSSFHLNVRIPERTYQVPQAYLTHQKLSSSSNENSTSTQTTTHVSTTSTSLDSSELKKKKLYVLPNRAEDIQSQRMNLPVCQEEFRIMEAIQDNPVVIICGETGSGKTTQIPQFLYEAGYSHPDSEYPKLIGVTQPRRVAAISMSQRVGVELNQPNLVSFQVRFEKTMNPETKIQFMTDGILLRELSMDLLLTKYSVIILDEAHERNLNTDILIGMLSRVVKHRNKIYQDWLTKKAFALKARTDVNEEERPKAAFPLKLIIMSATLRVSDFTENKKLFPIPPPVIHIEARQYPVTLHFNRITPQDHIKEAFKKVCQIHQQLPPGGILVFLTGQSEIYDLVQKLKSKFNPSKQSQSESLSSSSALKLSNQKKIKDWTSSTDLVDPSSSMDDRMAALDIGLLDHTLPDHAVKSEVSFHSIHTKKVNEIDDFDLAEEDTNKEEEVEEGEESDSMDLDTTQVRFTLPGFQSRNLASSQKENITSSIDASSNTSFMNKNRNGTNQELQLRILPFYSLLSSEDQLKVFESVPNDTRLCVIATNVAETSITIPGIRYVVDCGKAKEKWYDKANAAESFVITWISKASADQRAGRAGRVGPGHCYRLYSSSVFDRLFPLHSTPEILTMPIESVVLHLKAMQLTQLMNFPFPTCPSLQDIEKAEKLLHTLGALDRQCTITSLGHQMNRFPLHPRFAKMLLLSMQQGLMVYAIAIVAILSVGELFISTEELGFHSALASNSFHPKKKKKKISKDDQEFETFLQSEGLVNSTPTSMSSSTLSSGKPLKSTCDVILKFAGHHCDSDILMMLSLVGAYESVSDRSAFCAQHHLRSKSFQHIMALRDQLFNIMKTLYPTVFSNHPQSSKNQLVPPTDSQRVLLKQLMLAGFLDQLAWTHPSPPEPFLRWSKHCYQRVASTPSRSNSDVLLIDRHSVLASRHPELVTYLRLHQGVTYTWMKGVTKIEPSWLAHFDVQLKKNLT